MNGERSFTVLASSLARIPRFELLSVKPVRTTVRAKGRKKMSRRGVNTPFSPREDFRGSGI